MAKSRSHKLEQLPTSAILHVPVSGRSPGDLSVLPTGTLVPAGGRLTASAAQLDAWPLAPVAGRIAGPAEVQLSNGRSVQAVEFVPIDAADAPPAEALPVPAGIVPRGVAIDYLRSAGVWADRVASPHLLAQLADALHRPIDTVVCSVLDGDPNVPINAAVATLFVDRLIAGVREIARICEAGKAIVVVQQRLLPDVVAAVTRPPLLSAVQVVNDYPQADPTILFATVLKRKLLPGRLPTDAGALLLDAAAAVAVGDAMAGVPMLRVPVAVFDHVGDMAKLVSVPIGSNVPDIVSRCQPIGATSILRGGDVLRDCRLGKTAVIAGGELAVHISPAAGTVNPDPCIRCGWCVEACPSRIHPAGLLDAAQKRDEALADYYGLSACVECGLCDYVCPSQLPILRGIRLLRTDAAKPQAT